MRSTFITLMIFAVFVLALAACVPPTGTNQTNASNETVEITPENVTEKTETPANETEKPKDTSRTTETIGPEGKLPTKIIKEGELVSFPNLKVTDPEGDKINYIFTEPLDDKGMWQTKQGDAGTYKVRITASDGKNTVSQEVIIIVEEKNSAPSIESLSDVTVNEGETVKLAPKVTDPDGDKVTVRYSGWMSSDTKETTSADAGEYEVTVVANDGKVDATKTIKVMVKNVNRAPKLDSVGEIIKVKEGEKVTVLPTAKDPDGDKITYTFSAPLDEKGVWQTKKGDAGSYRVNITASDGELSETIKFFLAVELVNNAPVLTLENDKLTVNEGEKVVIKHTATDSDNDEFKVVFSGWMTAAEYATTYQDAGTHEVTVTADDGKEKATKTVTVTVNDVNRAPQFDQGSFS